MKSTKLTSTATAKPASRSSKAAQKTKYRYGNYTFTAKNQIAGVLIDPSLPRNFDNTPNQERPAAQAKWWNFPFVRTESVEELDAFYAGRTDEYAADGLKHWQEKGRPGWLEAWPSGTRYEVRCLDGGAWDRSTSWGMFPTLAAAIECATTGPARFTKAVQHPTIRI